MRLNQDLTLREIIERLAKSGGRLHLNFDHGVYHAYVHGDAKITAYDRGDLAQAIDGATRQAG
jgi:hypothetical protein